jgi:sulfoxide reductase heme-binding subunit YedZ
MAAPLPWLKPGVIAGAFIPGAVVIARAALGDLGANPISESLNRFGAIALVFLVASLACTPLKILAGWTWPIRLRKALGLIAFAYASLHLLTYVGVDQGLALSVVVEDVVKRPFILVGMLAWLIMVPLALTSTDRMVRRLGFNRWKRLHRLAYVAGALAAVHFYMRVKSDVREPLVYAVVLGTLLLLRAVEAIRSSRSRASPRPKAPPRPDPA